MNYKLRIVYGRKRFCERSRSFDDASYQARRETNPRNEHFKTLKRKGESFKTCLKKLGRVCDIDFAIWMYGIDDSTAGNFHARSDIFTARMQKIMKAEPLETGFRSTMGVSKGIEEAPAPGPAEPGPDEKTGEQTHGITDGEMVRIVSSGETDRPIDHTGFNDPYQLDPSGADFGWGGVGIDGTGEHDFWGIYGGEMSFIKPEAMQWNEIWQ